MKEWQKTIILSLLLALGVAAVFYGRYALSQELKHQLDGTTTSANNSN